MSNYSALKTDINNNIYENNTQQITGTVLNTVLKDMVNTLGAGYQFAGCAYLDLNPGAPDAKVFYLAGEGLYTNFDNIQVPAGKLGILKWDTRWHLETIEGLGGGGANLTGYISVASTDDLPDVGQPTIGYLCGTNLYLYVGEGGDTKDGKYQNCGGFRGPEGIGITEIEQVEQSTANGGRNTIRIHLSNGSSYDVYTRNGTTSTGLFPTLAALQSAYPSPVVGQYAFVGAGFPADIYVCNTAGTWTDSGADYDGDSVDLTDYATKAELNQLEAKVTNLVGYDTAPAWTANRNNYLVGEVCLYEGKRYICTTKHTAGATFDATKWEEKTVEGTLGNERAIYATFADLPATPGWVSSGKFINTNYHRRHKAVPIPGGASVTVKAPSSGSMSIFVTKSYSIPASGDSVDFATGEDIRTITANNTLTFTAPNDARFIIFNYQYDDSTITPAILVANGYDYLKNSRENIVDTLAKIADTNTSIASVKDDVSAVDGKVGGDSANTTYTSADYCGLYWASSQVKAATGNYNGILIPLIPGSKYTWNTGTAIQAFSAMPVAGSGAEYVRNVNSGFTADSTLKYLLLTVNITTFTGIVISNTAAGVYKDINTKAERLTMDDIRGLATQQGTFGTFSLTIQNIGSTKPFIISCDAKYSGGNTPPTIHFDIGNLYSSIYYTIGGNGDYERKQWRIPPMLFGLPLTIRVNVPSGCSLYIRDFDGREDGNITRYVGGLRLDAHLGFQGIAPENSIPAFVLAAECGYPASITNPIASADGTLYCYHEEDRTLKATGSDEIVSLTAAEFQSKTDAELADYRVVGLNTTNQSEYYDEKIPTLDDFFFICAKTGMRPMFSTHPEPTEAQWATIKGMLTKYGLLKMFSVKAASVSILEGAFAVFGNDIDAYIYDVSGTDTAAYVAALNGSTLAGATCRVGIEYEARDVTEAVATATLSAGYFVSVWAVSGLSGEGYYQLIRWGVTEFTDDYNPCSGLNF